jgi:hypothetical protein
MARDALETRLEPRAHLPFVDGTRLDVSCASLWPCHGRGMGKWGEVVCQGSRRVLTRLEPFSRWGEGTGGGGDRFLFRT